VGQVRPRGEEDGGRGGAEKTGAEVGRVKEHELRLIKVNGEASKGEPGPDPVPCSGDLRDGGEESGAQGVDVAVIDVEGEIHIIPVIRGAEEQRGGERGENRGEGRTLRSPLINGEGFRGVAVE